MITTGYISVLYKKVLLHFFLRIQHPACQLGKQSWKHYNGLLFQIIKKEIYCSGGDNKVHSKKGSSSLLFFF